MKIFGMWKTILAGLSVLLLASCLDSSGADGGFKRQYVVSRNALEAGQYDKAVRSYANLMQTSGHYEPWIRLEYAHALLRASQFPEAAEQAQFLATSQDGRLRSAALAVQGTAQHELGLILSGSAGKALLKSARVALAEALKKNPELDTLGTLKARKAQLDKDLKRRG